MVRLDHDARVRELSRVMLSIEVVFAGADPVPTFVFDEVDAGVGGKAAVEIGRRLARLARMAQVRQSSARCCVKARLVRSSCAAF